MTRFSQQGSHFLTYKKLLDFSERFSRILL